MLRSGPQFSLWFKVLYSAYLCILIPIYYAQWGPANFLWFSDIALVITCVALWLESSLLASMMAVGMLISGGDLSANALGAAESALKSPINLFRPARTYWVMRWQTVLCVIPLVGVMGRSPATQPANPFRANVKVEVTDELLIVHSNGLP